MRLAPVAFALSLAATSAHAVVLCARQRPDGTFNATVKVREVCKTRETQLDPLALGLQGPQGPEGPEGPQGPQGEPGVPGPAPADISVRVFNSTPVVVPNNVGVALTFDSERWDTDAMHDPTSPTRLTINTAGKYLLYCHTSFFPVNGIGARGLVFYRNGDLGTALATNEVQGDPSHNTEVSLTTHFEFAAGDYVEAIVAQDSGSTQNVATFIGSGPECGMVKLP